MAWLIRMLAGSVILIATGSACATSSWTRTSGNGGKALGASVEVPSDWKVQSAHLKSRRMIRAFSPDGEAGLLVVEQRVSPKSPAKPLLDVLAEFQFYATHVEGFVVADKETSKVIATPSRKYDIAGSGEWKGEPVRVVARALNLRNRSVVAVAYCKESEFGRFRHEMVRMAGSARSADAGGDKGVARRFRRGSVATR